MPADLLACIGKREEKISLGTKDPVRAKSLHARALLELDERWTNLRAGPKLLSEREAHEMVAPPYAWWIDQYRDEPVSRRSGGLISAITFGPAARLACRFNRTWVLRSSKRRQIQRSVLSETWRSGAPTKLMPC